MKHKIILVGSFFVVFTLYIIYSSVNHLKLKDEDTPTVKILQQEASKGDITALIKLAKLYEDSRGEYGFSLFSDNTAPYDKKIFELYEKAANLGSAEAQHQIAMMYYNGLGVTKNYSKGIEWDEKAAHQNYLKAKLVLASVYTDNYATPQNTFVDLKKAFYWNKQASQQGSALADFRLGMSYYYGEGTPIDYKKALSYLIRSANAGGIAAQTALGNYYEDCNTNACDNKQAEYWYKKAAQKGEPIASYNLGVFYELGRVGAKDYAKAMYWYQKAEDRGNGDGALAVGILYQEGKGVPQNYLEAKKHYEKATFYYNPDGYYMIGLLYEDGKGVTKNTEKADENFKKAYNIYQVHAENKEDINAPYMLAVLYMNGRGVTKDIFTAKKWLENAATRGNTQAKKELLSLSTQKQKIK